MRKSIKVMAGIRIVAAVLSILMFSGMTTVNIMKIDNSEEENVRVSDLLQKVQKAEAAHYKWFAGLNNSLYANAEFTGSTDPTGCVLGKWLYGETGTDDQTILDLRGQMEPLHKKLHESAKYVLALKETDPEGAQKYFQEDIQGILSSLVKLLDAAVERGMVLNQQSTEDMRSTMMAMHLFTGIGLCIAMFCLLSLVTYILRRIVKPILVITQKAKPLQDGCLTLELDYHVNDEIGDLSYTLKHAIGQTKEYIEEINRIMTQLSVGNFDVSTSIPFIGDFHSIADAIDSFTGSLSHAMANIQTAEQKIFGYAKTLSDGSQQLAHGATSQASAVEEITATLSDISVSAQQNIQESSDMRENAHLTGEQINVGSQQVELLVSAMKDISDTSREIQNIISTIENISFQTNILALNAAVEASRAGSAGRGFAVVAQEVRNLAGQSDEAAKATKELIENSVRASERGSKIVSEVSASLRETIRLVMQSNEAIDKIADAVQAEAVAISQAAEGLGQISNVVQTNSANSEESAAVSAELFEQVNHLKEQTRSFKLKKA